MILRFCSGSLTPASAVEELLARVDRDQAHAGGGDVVVLDLLALALAQQSVVDEDADELVADGLVHERGRDGGVDAARQAADHAAGADLRADALDLLGDDVAAVPVGGEPRGLVEEVLDDPLAVVGVLDLGMPLHAVQAALVAAERGDRGGRRRGEHVEALRGLRDLVAVAHPHVLLGGLAAEQHAAVARERGIRRPVLAQSGVGDLAAERLRHHLEAVADAERRHAEVEDARVERRGALLVHRRRAAREDDAHRVLRRDLGGGCRVRDDLAVDARLAHAARDQLRVLRAEVDDEHGALRRLGLLGHRWCLRRDRVGQGRVARRCECSCRVLALAQVAS